MAQTGNAGQRVGRSYLKYKVDKRRIRFNQWMMSIIGGIIVIFLFMYIGRMAQISANAKQIDALKKEIVQLEEQQRYLELHLATRQDMERVKDEATERLGMQAPSDENVRQISLKDYEK